MWLKEAKCREIVTQAWDRTSGMDVLTRIDCCGQDIWRWGKIYNRDFQRRIDLCKRKLDSLRLRRDDLSMQEYCVTERELLILLDQQHLFWKQRAKEHWYKGGDLNSKFFHNSVKSRKRRNKVHKLKNDSGNWVEGDEAIGQIMLDYFHKLFETDQGDMNEVVETIVTRITPQDNANLIRPVSTEEVRKAVFQMHPDKSPGPDGLGPGFFQHFWDIVGGSVTMFCRNFFETATLPTKANDTFIVLIPKKDKPESMSDLRPIALCNVVYKVAAKVCANRLKPFLEGLISKAHSAFVPG